MSDDIIFCDLSDIKDNESVKGETGMPIVAPQNAYYSAANNAAPVSSYMAPKPVPFTTTLKEKVMAFLIFVMAYIYFDAFCESDLACRIMLGVFTVSFLAFGEIMFLKRKRSVESFIFAGLMIISIVAYCFDIGNVWEEGYKLYFLHLFAVYWVMARSGCLAGGESSHLIWWDGVNGFFAVPFRNYPLAVRTIASIFKGNSKKDKKKIFISLGAVAVGLILFFISMALLKSSDANFDAIMKIFDIKLNWEYFWRFIFSSIIALYLYGLFGGCFRMGSERFIKQGDNINGFISRLNKVPGMVWVIFIALFSVFYVIFFLLQGSYLVEAFRMVLPSEYTFSQNAHKGFGNMCAVMIINFILMWFACRTSEKKNIAIKIASTVLIIESILFAIIAFLKLYMYIDVYGFTPLRLQSVWLVMVLTFACICILISLFTGKKTAKLWIIGSAVSLGIFILI